MPVAPIQSRIGRRESPTAHCFAEAVKCSPLREMAQWRELPPRRKCLYRRLQALNTSFTIRGIWSVYITRGARLRSLLYWEKVTSASTRGQYSHPHKFGQKNSRERSRTYARLTPRPYRGYLLSMILVAVATLRFRLMEASSNSRPGYPQNQRNKSLSH